MKDLKNNLFSVTRTIKDGASVANNGELLVVGIPMEEKRVLTTK